MQVFKQLFSKKKEDNFRYPHLIDANAYIIN